MSKRKAPETDFSAPKSKLKAMPKKKQKKGGKQDASGGSLVSKQTGGPRLLSDPVCDQAQDIVKEKVLLLCSRGTGARFRHLMLDLIQLLPHSKKDAKMDTKSDRAVINEVADLKGCSSILFFETRKKKDLYIWMAKSPEGPTVKFLAQNIHTMSELRLSGNHLKGSRPVLVFDKAFEQDAQWRLVKELLKQVQSVCLQTFLPLAVLACVYLCFVGSGQGYPEVLYAETLW